MPIFVSVVTDHKLSKSSHQDPKIMLLGIWTNSWLGSNIYYSVSQLSVCTWQHNKM